MTLRALCLCFLLLPASLLAQDAAQVRLFAPQVLVETGLLKHILPRFTLKTRVRVVAVAQPDDAHLSIGDLGTPVFEGAGQVWHLEVRAGDHVGADKFARWLRSEIGQRTVQGFAPGGAALFAPPQQVAVREEAATVDGDAALGHRVSHLKCTRCHAIDEATRGWGIGSTPSFGVLRAMPDWEERFAAFFVLKPHGAFTQITDVTEPFPVERPSPIAPIELTLDELDALLAYVATMPAADLGKPLEHQ
ncbi:hypothetical protein E4Z66_17970 [Aliishimia ponticola]|uniref:Cytochrome c domain-containing protein n=1 Tax=Aliishimia ponticola TaxID=2499833 RepID=A0A4S4N6S8_9RHOB|nr:cytochrome c [Aliishimia ponticola]THH34846.1 hypothetical protein E4Z66_17970 [Aliishimia ponticola]